MRVCFFGDSFVNGTGDDECLGWPGRLCAEARGRGREITLYNLGVRRDTSGDVARRWEQEASARLPPEQDGRLVFSFGVNDCVCEQGLPRVSEDVSVANTRTILAGARARWPTLMVGPPCIGDAATDRRIGALSDRMKLVCDELALPFLPILARSASSEVWCREAAQGDGVHPNREGYASIMQIVLSWQSWRDWTS